MRLANIDDGFSSGVSRFYFGDINHDRSPLFDRDRLLGRSVVPELRSPAFLARSPTFPRLGLPEGGGRENADCVARWSLSSRSDFSPLPSDGARRVRRASTTARA